MVGTIVYFSSVTNNTHRCVENIVNFSRKNYPLLYKDGQKVHVDPLESLRIPLKSTEEPLLLDRPFVLITPTYGGTMAYDKKKTKMIPIQVQKFLSHPQNAHNLKGVIGMGNLNFGEDYAKAAQFISDEYHVPLLYKAELMGTDEDYKKIALGLLDVK